MYFKSAITIVLLSLLDGTVSEESPHSICVKSKIINNQFDPVIAVPIFASENIAEAEMNSVFEISAKGTNVQIKRINNSSEDCQPGFITEVEHVNGKVTNYPIAPHIICIGNYPSWDISSVYMADDLSLTLLVVCNGSEVSMTVLAACFMITKDRNLTVAVGNFLMTIKVPKFAMVEVNYTKRWYAYKDKMDIESFKRCSTKQNKTIIALLYIFLIAIVLVIGKYIMRKKKSSSVSPASPEVSSVDRPNGMGL